MPVVVNGSLQRQCSSLSAVVAQTGGFIIAPSPAVSRLPATSGPWWLAGVKALHVDACGRRFLLGGVLMASTVPHPLDC
jgi:hypothetical protein